MDRAEVDYKLKSSCPLARQKSQKKEQNSKKALFVRVLGFKVLPDRVGLMRVKKLPLPLSVFDKIFVQVLQVLAL